MKTTKHLPVRLVIRAAGDEPEIVITTPARDLMRDTIDPMGMETDGYLHGTCAVNFAHNHSKLPVGKTVSLVKSPQGIRARFRWLGATPEAGAVRAAFAEGVLGASVEFVPVESERNGEGGTHYAKSILTGWALTASPANPACMPMLKALGLGRAAADEIDVTREQIRAAFEATRPWLADEVRRKTATAVAVARCPGEIDLAAITLDDEPDELGGLSERDVRAAFRAVLPPMVDERVRRALRIARGRLD